MENKAIELNDFEIVCRICLNKKENMISMFENAILPNLIKTYKEMLEDCASVQISCDDLLPKNICPECLKYLEQSYQLKIQYLSSEKRLGEIIANTQTNIKEEVSIDEDNDFKSNFYNSDDTSQSEIIKKEFCSIKEEINKTSNREENGNDSHTYRIEQKYKCEECGKQFHLKGKFYKHQLVHSKMVKCMYCDKTYKSYIRMKYHSPEILQCGKCQQIYGCRNTLRDHVFEHSTTCDICGRKFQTAPNCKRHRRTHGDKRYLCTYCGQAFADYSNYIVHVRIHTGEKPYHCTQCDSKFKDSYRLKQHYITHSGERKFECEICKNKYKRKEDLYKHKKTHSERTNYSCNICNKKYKNKGHLNHHQLVHKDERNYVCTYCSKAFYTSYNLKVHLRIHTGEKPFTCSKCGKKFGQKHVLNSHMKTHFEVPG